MLTALLVVGGPGLPGDALVAAVWGDTHDRMGSVKSCMAELRRLLPGRIPLGTSAGYRIQLGDDDTFDLALFQNLTAESAARMEVGDRAAAARLLRQALGLWGDPPLVDLPGEIPALQAIRAKLLSERKSALTAFLRLELEFGRHQAILSDLWEEVDKDPLSEELHELLMRALYMGGRRAEALQHYRAAAKALLRETGHSPGAALTRAYAEISADAEHVTAPFPQARGELPQPAQLPADVVDFVGREQEVEYLLDVLTPRPGATAVPIAVISGMGGIGKSALAVHVAHRLRPLYPDGQLFVRLAGMSGAVNVNEMLAELLTSLRVPALGLPASTVGRAAVLRSVLAGRRVLVVIDDAAALYQAQPFLPGTGECGVIITSRVLLHGPGIRSLQLAPLGGGEALHLLREIVGATRIEREPDASDEVLAACGGLPLTVRIAGARLLAQPHWPVRLLAERLQDRLRGLEAGDLAVAASIGESYDALGEGARAAFKALSLAGPGDWPMWLAEMLLGAQEGDAALGTLTVHSLLTPAGVGAFGHPRYRMHDLVHAFAAERLAEDPTGRDVAMERLLFGWMELVALADEATAGREPYYPPPIGLGMDRYVPAAARALITADPDGWVASEVTTITRVVRVTCAAGWHRVAYGTAARVSGFLYRRGLRRESEEMWRAVMHAAHAGNDPWLGEEARHRVASLILEEQGGPGRARPMLDLCAASFERIGHHQALARSLAVRATCDYLIAQEGGTAPAGDPADDGRRGLGIARTIGDRYAELACLRALGLTASVRGEHDQALGYCGQAVEVGAGIAADVGEQTYQVWALGGLITVQMAAGRYEEALATSVRARPLARAAGNFSAEAAIIEQAGDALVGAGRAGEAVAVYAEAAAVFSVAGAHPRRERCEVKRAAASPRG